MTDLPHGLTMLLLTDAESRIIRLSLDRYAERLERSPVVTDGNEAVGARSAVIGFNRGITRGTAKMAADFKARADEKKARGK